MTKVAIQNQVRSVRFRAAEDGEYLDILVNDKDWLVRRAVAECGLPQHWDILVKDRDLECA